MNNSENVLARAYEIGREISNRPYFITLFERNLYRLVMKVTIKADEIEHSFEVRLGSHVIPCVTLYEARKAIANAVLNER